MPSSAKPQRAPDGRLMPRLGKCKLCLEGKELQESHLLPAALYKMMRSPGATNPHPIVVTRKVSVQSSKQVKAYLLCGDCEQRFNRNGEQWIIRQVYNGTSFPLLDRLNVALPIHSTRSLAAFSGLAVGIDTGKLSYFVLSVLWRASAHKWVLPYGARNLWIDLGIYKEPIRKFLLEGGPFPSDVVVVVTVCTDIPSQQSIFTPAIVPDNQYRPYALLTRGIYFRVFTGNMLPPDIRTLCCFASSRKLLFLTTCEDKSLHAFGNLLSTGKLSHSLK